MFEASGGLTTDEAAAIDVGATVAAGTVPGVPDSAAFASAVAGALPRGRFVSFDELGHFGPLEAPGAVAAAAARELLGDQADGPLGS